MAVKSNYIKPKFRKESNPKIGLLALFPMKTTKDSFDSYKDKVNRCREKLINQKHIVDDIETNDVKNDTPAFIKTYENKTKK